MQRACATWWRQACYMQVAPVLRAACLVAACGNTVGEPPSLWRAVPVGPVRSPCAFCCQHTLGSQTLSVPSSRRGAGNPERSACASCQHLAACSRITSVANVRHAVCVRLCRVCAGVVTSWNGACSSRQLGGCVHAPCRPTAQLLLGVCMRQRRATQRAALSMHVPCTDSCVQLMRCCMLVSCSDERAPCSVIGGACTPHACSCVQWVC